MEFRFNKKEDDEVFLPFQTIDKMQVVQEGKQAFNEASLNPRKCVFMITKILYLLGQGDTLNSTTANDLFFSSTKLFISDDVKLRRMLYLLLKDLSPFSQQAFVAINSLFKDMSSKNEDFKANAIRTLRKITDQHTVMQLDRHLKQAVVDQNKTVSSAALVSGYHIAEYNADLVKRWIGEIQSTLKSNHHMVQYHALAVLHKLKRSDSLAVSKLVSSNMSTFRSPLAHTLLIKYCVGILNEERSANGERSKQILKYLDSCLTYKSDMIVLQAAKVMCNLDFLTPKEVTPAVLALQSFLTSSKPVYRFSAIRILNKLANRVPILTSLANHEMEELVHDPNRNIATLAITTLLKTGSETNIDKLMKQIGGFMGEIPDEFKIVVVEAMKGLCLQYPFKHNIMLAFLSNALREEGGYEYKKSIVDTIITIIEKIPQSKEAGITYLCEFIEDCEFTLLLQQVLHFLGNEGPKSLNPSKCIRYIYNRVILESAPVRASAVIALAKFAAKVPNLRPSVTVILRRTMLDNDDEVRDRAVFYLSVIENKDEEMIKQMICDENDMNISNMEVLLKQYIESEDFSKSFDIKSVPEKAQPKEVENGEEVAGETSDKKSMLTSTSAATPSAEILQSIPELAKLGNPFKTCLPVALSEDLDYVVTCVKHVFSDCFVLQFICTNKVESQRLRDMRVELDFGQIEGLKENYTIIGNPVPLDYNATGNIFVRIERDGSNFAVGTISAVLKYVVDSIDTETGEVEEEGDEEEDFDLEDLPITITDYMSEKPVNFKEAWDSVESETQTQSKEQRSKDSLQVSIDKLVKKIGLQPLNGRKVTKKSSHTAYFSGEFCNGDLVLMGCQISIGDDGVTKKYVIRSKDEEIRNKVAAFLTEAI